MNIARNILGVIVGYLIFAVSAVLLFQLSGIDPHADAGIGTMVLVIVFGAFFAFIGGYTARLIAFARSLAVNIVLFCLIAGFALISLLKSDGSHYTQIAAILFFAPMSMAGGILRKKAEA